MVKHFIKALAESLIVHDLALAQKAQGRDDVGILHQPQHVFIGGARLLLCCNGKSATFDNKINPIGLILYHILPLAKYITKNSNVLLSERPWFWGFSCLRKCSQ